MAEEAVSFSAAFFADWTIAARRVGDGRRFAESVIEVLRERATLEEEYAKGLKCLSSRLIPPPTESQSTTTAVNSLKKEFMHRAEQANEWAAAIRADVLGSMMSSTMENHAAVFHQIQIDGDNVTKNLRSARQEYQRAVVAYVKACESAEGLCAQVVAFENAAPVQRSKIAYASLRASTSVDLFERRYKRAANALEEAQNVCARQVDIILHSLQDMDTKRVACLKDGLRKAMVFETAYLRNLQYDLESTIQAIEIIDEAADVKEFINTFQSKDSKKSFPIITGAVWPDMPVSLDCDSVHTTVQSKSSAINTARRWFKNSSIDLVVQSAATAAKDFGITIPSSGPLDGSFPDPPCETTVSRIEGVYEELLEAIWSWNFQVLTTIQPTRLYEEFSSSLFRSTFCRRLTARRASDKFRLANIHALRALGTLCESALEWADRQDDFWTGRCIMVMSHYFYAEGPTEGDPQGKRWKWPKNEENQKKYKIDSGHSVNVQWFLNRCLYYLAIWNRVPFWEESLIATLSEWKHHELLSRRWHRMEAADSLKEQKLFRDSHPCALVLPNFGAFMVTFGIVQPQVVALISRVAASFGLDDEFIQSLTDNSRFVPLSLVQTETPPEAADLLEAPPEFLEYEEPETTPNDMEVSELSNVFS